MTLAITYKSSEFFGKAVKEEYISEKKSFYSELSRYLSNDMDALIGAKIFIDYNTFKRGSITYSEIVELENTPAEKAV